MGCEGNGCLGLAHDGNGFGLELGHQAQVCDEDGCLGFVHGKDIGLE